MRLEIKGIKNISNKITLDFSNKTFNKSKCNYTKIKAIYGGNGTGKSAIINALNLYKNISYQDKYLSQDDVQRNLKALANKNCDEIYLKAYFGCNEKTGENSYYSHEISIKDKKSVFCLTHERFSSIVDRTLAQENERTIYEVVDGKLISLKEDLFFAKIEDKTKNLLSSSTLISTLVPIIVIGDYIKQNDKKDVDNQKIMLPIYHLLIDFLNLDLFLNFILVELEAEDKHIINKKSIKDYLKPYNIPTANGIDEDRFVFETSKTDKVLKKFYKVYLKGIEQLTKFIKIFKPALKEIKIDKKVDGSYYRCNKIFSYDGCDIDIEYESTGIKKLVELFPCINAAVNGKIVFIDEFDANINGVFLIKLLEFFQKEGKGQLCFTSHNLEPLNLLKSLSHAIDFIGETGKVISWTSCGNYSARNLYLEGMIEDSPFNFDYYDFYPIFCKEDNKND